MKKLFVLLTILALVVLAGCQPKDPFEEFLDTMNKEENAEMVLNMEVPFFGEVEVIMELDGNKTHTSEFLTLPETYTEEVDGVTYQYMKNLNGAWEKSVQEDTEDDDTGMEVVDELKYEDFTKLEDGRYELNADKKEGYQVNSLIIELTDTGAIMTMTVKEQGIILEMEITIRKIGEVKITLPVVNSSTAA